MASMVMLFLVSVYALCAQSVLDIVVEDIIFHFSLLLLWLSLSTVLFRLYELQFSDTYHENELAYLIWFFVVKSKNRLPCYFFTGACH